VAGFYRLSLGEDVSSWEQRARIRPNAGRRQAKRRPEAGQTQAGGRPEAGMNEEASAGEEVIQNRPTIFRKEGRIVKLKEMIKLLNPPVPMEEPLPHDSE